MTSRSKAARVAGLLYILSSLVGALRLIYIPKALIVSGNAAATANNLASNELLFHLGIISLLLGSVLWLLVPVALYRLLKGVDQTLAVLMVILGSLMQVPLFLVNGDIQPKHRWAVAGVLRQQPARDDGISGADRA